MLAFNFVKPVPKRVSVQYDRNAIDGDLNNRNPEPSRIWLAILGADRQIGIGLDAQNLRRGMHAEMKNKVTIDDFTTDERRPLAVREQPHRQVSLAHRAFGCNRKAGNGEFRPRVTSKSDACRRRHHAGSRGNR